MRLLPLILMAALPLLAADPIRYTVRFPAPHTHYVQVEADVPTAGQPQVELMMAVWTPGSYLVREYSRHVENVRASSGTGGMLAVTKTAKNHWRVTTGGAPRVRVSYQVYGREMSVRTNWVESGFALLNGAPTFLTLTDTTVRPHEVQLELPAAWKTSMTGLREMPGQPHHYVAEDFDTLVDSPILAGNPTVHEFTVDGKRHYLVNEGEAGVFDGKRAVKDVETIVEHFRRMFGGLPYDKYVFLNLLTEAGGGLEHKNSTVLMASRWATRTPERYRGWLGLVSHEFFHVWNVKRLRPVELGPFEYEREVYTPSLWISEGFTSYYGDLGVRRAGLMNLTDYLEALSRNVRDLQTTPGRLSISAADSSLDAWIRQYRPDENTPNTSISYYTKGEIIGFLLDARIRRVTNDAKSLDDVMRLAYEKYSGAKGFTPEQFRQAINETAGRDLGDEVRRMSESTEELDYRDALDWYGLRFAAETPKPDTPPKAWLGATTRVDAGRLLVSQVRRGTPVHEAQVNVDDEILAIDDFRVRPDGMTARLDAYRPGDKVTLLVARRDQLVRLPVVLGRDPGNAWKLEADPKATDAQKAHRRAWLHE